MRLIELIDRSSLLEKAKKYEFWNGALYQWHCVDVKDIVNAPTVDAVEVVRCKDCLFARKNDDYRLFYNCEKPLYDPQWGERPHIKLVQDCDFCSHGVRKEQ